VNTCDADIGAVPASSNQTLLRGAIYFLEMRNLETARVYALVCVLARANVGRLSCGVCAVRYCSLGSLLVLRSGCEWRGCPQADVPERKTNSLKKPKLKRRELSLSAWQVQPFSSHSRACVHSGIRHAHHIRLCGCCYSFIRTESGTRSSTDFAR
jgi:transposase